MTRDDSTRVEGGLRPELGARWDWYSASVGDSVAAETVVDSLRVVLGGALRVGPGRHGFGVREELLAGDRVIVGVSHGGGQERALVEASGWDTGRVAGVVRSLWPEHRVTRVDSAVDFDAAGAWQELSVLALAIARAAGVSTSVAGDWLGQVKGRTLYVGAPSSVVRMRIYEKGRQLREAKRPDWVRCELQVRPERAARFALAHLEPGQVWGCSRWAARFMEALTDAQVVPVSMRQWVMPDDLRARETMKAQYGGAIRRWKAEYGDWATFGEMLGSELERL